MAPEAGSNSGGDYENRSLLTTIGSSQTVFTVTTSGISSAKKVYIGRFTSPPLATQTIPEAIWDIGIAAASNRRGILNPQLYIWRPSTSAKVANLRDDDTGVGVQGPPGTTNTERWWLTTLEEGVAGSSAPLPAVDVLNGDVLVCEMWIIIISAGAGARDHHIWFDGATEDQADDTAISDAASWIEHPETITFYTADSPLPQIIMRF